MKNVDKQVILPKEASVVPEFVNPRQSANSLFHFMNDERWLLNKIRDKALKPRYTLEDVSFLKLPNIEKMYYPMICFCDINLHRIQPHYDQYGPYGIAFSKKWGIEKGIQPIHYLNQHGEYLKEFKQAFDEGMGIADVNVLKDFWLETLRFIKPMQGCNICHGEKTELNFMDECEWRFVPTGGENALLPAIVAKNHFDIKSHNDALENDSKYWITFNYSDIKYLILPDQEKALMLMKYCKDIGIPEIDRDILYTKIINWQDFREDV